MLRTSFMFSHAAGLSNPSRGTFNSFLPLPIGNHLQANTALRRGYLLAYRSDAKRVFVDAVQNSGGLRHTHSRMGEESSQFMRGRRGHPLRLTAVAAEASASEQGKCALSRSQPVARGGGSACAWHERRRLRRWCISAPPIW